MLLSIVIPVYNAEKFLSSCIHSVQENIDDIEIILVNDGSTDGSGKICDEFGEKYSCIKVFHQVNKGVSGARNKGIEIATGKYIMFLDSDDFLSKGNLELMIKDLMEYNPDLMSFGLQRIYPDKIQRSKLLFKNKVVYKGHDEIKENIYPFLQENRILMPACIYKSDILKEHNIKFEEHLKYSEDYLFLITYVRYVTTFFYFPEYVYNYVIALNHSSRNYEGVLNSICEVGYCDLKYDALRELGILDEQRYRMDELNGIHYSLCGLYNTKGLMHINSNVDKRLSLIKSKNINLKEIPIKPRILLKLLINKHYKIYYFLLRIIRAKQ